VPNSANPCGAKQGEYNWKATAKQRRQDYELRDYKMQAQKTNEEPLKISASTRNL